ncbi:MAG: hypothetical protein BWK76_17660 [Desulfobulbaceae bacterium A2]|nr:MAG: hypothetical protein BWK76_17660 [Desulfobulbaceae bacterium A2]
MQTEQKTKPIGRTLLFGALTAGIYGVLFAFPDTIAHTFARGAWWAAGPIATVFLFSYIHGSFAHNLWESLGIQAIQKRPVQRPAQRPRATINA